jgi:hypothetical protein
MSRRIVALVLSLFTLLGTMAMLAPTSSAVGSWATLARHCWTIQHDADRLRACTSIKGGLVDGGFMIRTRCRVKMLNFEAPWIQVKCWLDDGTGFVASGEATRNGVTGLIVKTTPLVLCDPTRAYGGGMNWGLLYPDGSSGGYGLGVEWPEWPNTADCSPPT